MQYRAMFATAVLALAAAGATAQQPPKKPSGEATLGGGASTGGAALTRDQLRQCLVEQDALKTTSGELARDQQAIDADKAEIGRAGATLKEQLDQLDRTSEEAVKAHVEKAQTHDKRIEEWNARLPAFNERVEALNRRGEGWKGQCAGRRYKEDDLILLQARKQVPTGAKP